MLDLEKLADEAEAALAPRFAAIDRIARVNTAKVLSVFREERVSVLRFREFVWAASPVLANGRRAKRPMRGLFLSLRLTIRKLPWR